MNNKKQLKIVTYIDRINILSDTFIKYYLKFFESEEFHFLVLDTKFEKIRDYLLNKSFSDKNLQIISNEYYYPTDRILSLQNQTLDSFLNQGFIVLYADIDEIIYHHDLRNYVLNNIIDYITPSGIILVPNTNESYLDSTTEILNQCKNGVFDDKWYAKTCILNKEYVWTGGRHNKGLNKIHTDIFLIDISKCCPKIMLENNKITKKLYKDVISKYSTETDFEISAILSTFMNLSKPLPKYVLDTKLF